MRKAGRALGSRNRVAPREALINIMAMSNRIFIRIDEDLKEQAGEILAEMGLSFSEVMRQLLLHLIMTRNLPVEFSGMGRELSRTPAMACSVTQAAVVSAKPLC